MIGKARRGRWTEGLGLLLVEERKEIGERWIVIVLLPA
jgi:hypothetical protein